MQIITGYVWPAVLFACALGSAYVVVMLARNRKKWLPDLAHVVELDARGWRLIAIVSGLGAIAMIATSQMFAVTYWVGMAIENEKIEPLANAGWVRNFLHHVTVMTASFFVLSVFFDLLSDTGTIIASGLKQKGRKGTPHLLMVAVALGLVMSVASKWGIYEDARQVRKETEARVTLENSSASKDLAEAEATIARLVGRPPVAIAIEKRATIENQLKTMEAALAEAKAARDVIPESHSTNRAKAQVGVDEWNRQIIAKEGELLDARQIETDAAELEAAKAARASAETELKETAGKTKAEGEAGRTKVGDLFIVRAIRTGLHQLLCLLLPIISIDAITTSRKVAREEAEAERRRKAEAEGDGGFEFDADFEEPADEDRPPPFGGYFGPAQPGEAGGSGEDELTGEPPELDSNGGKDATS